MSTVVWTTLIVSQQSICEFQEPKVRKISPIDFQQYYKGGNTGNRITSEAHRRNFGIGCRNEMGWRWPALYVYKQCSACQLPIVRLATRRFYFEKFALCSACLNVALPRGIFTIAASPNASLRHSPARQIMGGTLWVSSVGFCPFPKLLWI